MSSGIVVRPAERLLVERARDFLAAGPAEAVELVAHVCQLPRPPRTVAEHMAGALLGEFPEFALGDDGRWRLVRETAAPASGGELLRELSYAVVDVETTGGRADGGDRVTEVAAVVVRGGEIVDVYETLVNPQRPIPAFITQLTNISWAMVKDAPIFGDVCGRLCEVLRGHVFVAHNATFDWKFVTAEVSRASGETLDGRRLCTVRLSRRLLPQLPRRSLDHVARHYGVEIGARHRAAGDAIATARVLLRLIEDAADRGIVTWSDLDGFLSAPSGRPRRPRRGRSGLPTPVDKDTTA